MSLKNTLNNLEFPNINDILKSGKQAKNKIDNSNANAVIVNFHYSDGRFKTTVEGIITHESEVPIVYIDYPEKLAFLIPDNSLVYDIKKQKFEVSVNEKYTHCLNISDSDNNNIEKAIIPYLPENLNYEIVEIEVKNKINNKTDKIVLTAKMLSSLGRAKILERTVETSNDGLMIMAFLGALIGFILGMIVGLKSVV